MRYAISYRRAGEPSFDGWCRSDTVSQALDACLTFVEVAGCDPHGLHVVAVHEDADGREYLGDSLMQPLLPAPAALDLELTFNVSVIEGTTDPDVRRLHRLALCGVLDLLRPPPSEETTEAACVRRETLTTALQRQGCPLTRTRTRVERILDNAEE